MEGIEHGFKIGFTCTGQPVSVPGNRSQMGRTFGPLEAEILPTTHISRFGVIPKNHQPGKWRLSGPRGASVNDGIEKELCLLKYVSVDEAMREVIVMGQGTQLEN